MYIRMKSVCFNLRHIDMYESYLTYYKVFKMNLLHGTTERTEQAQPVYTKHGSNHSLYRSRMCVGVPQ